MNISTREARLCPVPRQKRVRHWSVLRTAVASIVLSAAPTLGGPVGVSPALAAGASAPSSVVIYPLPTAGAQPYDLAVAPNGNLWSPYNFASVVAKITPAGAVSELPLGFLIFPRMTADRDGNLWLLDLAQRSVDKLDAAGALVARFPVPGSGGIGDIAYGPDGNVWYTNLNEGQVGRVTPTGEVTIFQSPTGPGGAGDVVAGSDGNIWFADPFGDKVGRITMSGTLTEFDTPAGDGPFQITEGPDGNRWYTKTSGRIGRITAAGAVTEFVLPAGSVPTYITTGADGNLWYKDGRNSQIGRITPAGVVGVFKADGQSNGGNIVAGRDGRIWFTLEGQASVAAFLPFAPPPSPPDIQSVAPRSTSTAGGTKVVVTGYNVDKATNVLFGSTPATTFRALGPGQLEAVAPRHGAGAVNVTVVTPSGRTGVGDAAKFFYTSPACGQVITQSTTLSADIGPCYNDGVVIGADNVTLDLGGRSIYNFQGPSDGHAVGVRLPQRSGVTVKNGTVRGFDAGLVVRGGGSNVLTNLTIQDNVGPDDAINSELGDGVFIEDSPNNQVVGNTLSHNGVYDGIGIYGPGSNANVVKGNLVENTVGPSDGGPAGQGIITNGAGGDGPSTSVSSGRIENNTVRDNASAGIANINHIGGSIIGNTAVGNGLTNSFGNGIGVSVGFNWTNGPTQMLIQGNQVHGNGVDGIRIGNPFGFGGGRATGNTIVNNDAADNNANPHVNVYEGGIPGFDLHDLNANCDNDTWNANTWGTGGYSPACAAAGGSGPAGAAKSDTQATESSGPHANAWKQLVNNGRPARHPDIID